MNRAQQQVQNSADDSRRPRDRGPALLLYAFRPMFLAAGSWAAIALALWLSMFFGYVEPPTRFDPLSWHIHEMLFGFVMAAVAGFLLTAIPNWTGRLRVRGSGRAGGALGARAPGLPRIGRPARVGAASVGRHLPNRVHSLIS